MTGIRQRRARRGVLARLFALARAGGAKDYPNRRFRLSCRSRLRHHGHRRPILISHLASGWAKVIVDNRGARWLVAGERRHGQRMATLC